MNLTPITAGYTIDTTGLSAGIREAEKWSSRTPVEIVNTSAYWIAVNTKNDLPFVTPEKIDSELAVIKHPVIGKRGKPLKNKKRFTGGIAPNQLYRTVPLAALIVAARANPNSKYNQLTNQRYRLAANPFKGVSRAAGRAAMAGLVDKMIKLRHKSGKFLLAGWIRPILIMKEFAAQKYIRGGGSPLAGSRQFYGAQLGDASPATIMPGKYEAVATAENDVGMEGQNAASFNRALMLFGVPSLQRAIDREGTNQMNYALKKAGEELERQVNKHWS